MPKALQYEVKKLPLHTSHQSILKQLYVPQLHVIHFGRFWSAFVFFPSDPPTRCSAFKVTHYCCLVFSASSHYLYEFNSNRSWSPFLQEGLQQRLNVTVKLERNLKSCCKYDVEVRYQLYQYSDVKSSCAFCFSSIPAFVSTQKIGKSPIKNLGLLMCSGIDGHQRDKESTWKPISDLGHCPSLLLWVPVIFSQRKHLFLKWWKSVIYLVKTNMYILIPYFEASLVQMSPLHMASGFPKIYWSFFKTPEAQEGKIGCST